MGEREREGRRDRERDEREGAGEKEGRRDRERRSGRERRMRGRELERWCRRNERGKKGMKKKRVRRQSLVVSQT